MILSLYGFFAKCLTQLVQGINYAINCSSRTLCRRILRTLVAKRSLYGFLAKYGIT